MDFENLWNTLLDYWLIRVPFQNQHESIQMLWSNLAVTSWKWHRAHWHEIPGPLGRPMILSGVRVVHWKHPPRPLENPKSMWEDNYSFLQLHLKWRSVGTAGVGRCILIQQWWPEMCHAVSKWLHVMYTCMSPHLRPGWDGFAFNAAGGWITMPQPGNATGLQSPQPCFKPISRNGWHLWLGHANPLEAESPKKRFGAQVWAFVECHKVEDVMLVFLRRGCGKLHFVWHLLGPRDGIYLFISVFFSRLVFQDPGLSALRSADAAWEIEGVVLQLEVIHEF